MDNLCAVTRRVSRTDHFKGSRMSARIAVIAVHGVADQQPYETARSVVNLLHAVDRKAPVTASGARSAAPANGTRPAPEVHYTKFVESALHIPVSPLRLSRVGRQVREQTPSAAPAPSNAQRAARQTLYSSYEARRLNRDQSAGDPDQEFMYNQLRDYTGTADPASHQTVGLSGVREAQGAGGGRADVDVYELYWADLSRLGTGVLRILGELYQLLFHMSSLGRTTVGVARVQNDVRRVWRALSLSQSISSFLLVLPIAVFNLYLVVLAFGLVVTKVPDEPRAWVAVAVGSMICALLFAVLAYRQWHIGFGRWSITQAAGFVIGALAMLLLLRVTHAGAYPLLAGLWIALTLLIVWPAATAYEKRRPGAVKVALVGAAIVVVSALWTIPSVTDSADGAVLLVGRPAEALFYTLTGLWAALILFHLCTWLLGHAAIWLTPREPELNMRDPRSQARRAVWTGCIGLFVPTSVFLILTLTLWLLLLKAVGKQLEAYSYESMIGQASSVSSVIDDWIERSAGLSFNGFLILIALSLVMVVWAFFPAVLAERTPPKEAGGDASRRLGHWLDHGFRLARWAGGIALLSVFVILPFGIVFTEHLPEWLRALSEGNSLLLGLVTVLGGSTVGLVALGRNVSKTLAGFRAPLDIALDVDNWLRERPLDANPTARICARYVSLLRQICQAGVEEGRPYTAIVIVAHSQGTVITADLLRFMRQNQPPEPALQRLLSGELPVYLFTMGCPLRQLYGRRFPHQYEWATHPAGAKTLAPSRYGCLEPDLAPRPDELGVALWVNAFRSGDYVGRHLWLADEQAGRWEAARQNSAGVDYVATDSPSGAQGVGDVSRVELCLGAGAHTHYFDESALRVAHILDQLLGIAITGKAAYPFAFPDLSRERR